MQISFQPVILTTDAFIYLLLVVGVIAIVWTYLKQHSRESWKQVFERPLAVISIVILVAYIIIGVLDSIHFNQALPQTIKGQIQYSSNISSVLDLLMHPLDTQTEETYSAPFATHLYDKQFSILPNGKIIYDYPPLLYAGNNLKKLNRTHIEDILILFFRGAGIGIVISSGILIAVWLRRHFKKNNSSEKKMTPSTYALGTMVLIVITAAITISLSSHYHILGTDKVGQDIFYETIKSIRTGLVIGMLTTLVMLPFAILLGSFAGYFGGLVDDIIQYLYTTLSSIPGVLLIAASILSLQIFIENHPDLFSTIMASADARLFALCVILGITSWTSLCRLLRGETLKLREMDYIQAATALGVNHGVIILRHIIPNLLHIVLITVVLDFSNLVLAEAVLSYVGVGVDPTTISWGNMINSARLELARDPIVWWPLLAAFLFMFALVLAANLFADAVRDSFDPRIKQR